MLDSSIFFLLGFFGVRNTMRTLPPNKNVHRSLYRTKVPDDVIENDHFLLLERYTILMAQMSLV